MDGAKQTKGKPGLGVISTLIGSSERIPSDSGNANEICARSRS